MSVLRTLESKIAGFVEGTFSRAFRSEVRPVELARKLAREMEEHKSSSLTHVYVPHEYRVFLSRRDRERFADYEAALADELAGYLLEHARREELTLMARPVIEFETDPQLGLGEFGIQTGIVQAPQEQVEEVRAEPEPPPVPEPQPPPPPVGAPGAGRTMVYSSASRLAEPLEERARSRAEKALLLMDGRRMVVASEGVSLGRSRSCDIVLSDPNVSRRHAEIRPRGGSWVLVDLGSTNGSRINGRSIEGSEVVKPGDQIELGSTRLTFELE
ncbi:MAG TPA: DUF3662 and FHA domain-containing protein [Solirubrobacteraceae bacterium]|nr:DUF3662 and FHA domain-containing protein [Solirubrobacteraceae bacterium]